MLLTYTWVAFLLRAMNLDWQSQWRDEVDAIRFSSWPGPELLAGLFRVGHNGPLFFLLLRPWRSLSGDTEFALRYPAVLLGTLAVPLGFILTRQLGFSRRAGLLLSLLLATSPYLVWYGQEAKMYALLLALVSLAFIVYLKALSAPSGRGSGWLWWLVFVAATSLTFYTHILAPLMLIVYTFVALLNGSNLRRHWRGWLVSMTCLTLPYLPLLVWQAPLLLNGFQSGHPFYPLDKQIFILLQLYSSGLVRFMGLTAIILYVFLFLCGLFLSERVFGNSGSVGARQVGSHLDLLPRHHADLPRPYELVDVLSEAKTPAWNPDVSYRLSFSRLILAGWVLLPPLIVFLISLRVAVFEDRYLIYIVPGFYLLTVVGLLLVRRYSRLLAGLCLGLLLAINLLGIWQQQRQPLKADFRAVAGYLSRQPQPPSTIMLQLPYLQYTFDYYYRQPYTLLEGLWTNNGKSEAMVDAEMTALTADLPELWLIVSEEEAWDSRRLTRTWLDTHASLLDEAHFVRVDVYHYRFQPDPDETQRVGQE